jgi:glyoxylase-like metal-dependent hydrolase (beta-lactamase superfamily II)
VIFLTHRDDVADAEKYAAHFGAKRVIHRAELDSQPNAERVIDGYEPIALTGDLLAIPTPGHTAGHCCLLFANRYLFTGDHLYFDRHLQRLNAFQDYCWDSWPQQVESLRRLIEYSFEWVLPGHGQRVRLSPIETKRQLTALVTEARSASA